MFSEDGGQEVKTEVEKNESFFSISITLRKSNKKSKNKVVLKGWIIEDNCKLNLHI